MITDLRFLVRGLLRSPSYTLIASGTLGLAIGLNTAIFSMVGLFIFEQYPMKDPDRLAFIRASNPQQDLTYLPIPAADFLDYQRQTTVFESLAATDRDLSYVMDAGGDPLRVRGYGVTANLLSIWGLEPQLGRDFTAEDDRPGAPDVAILGHGFWERQFGSDPGIIGSGIRLNGRETTVIGVIDPELEHGFYSLIDVWTPLRLNSATASREVPTILPEGRLKDGRTLSEARAEIGRIAADIKQRFPTSHAGVEVRVLSWDETLTSPNSYLILWLLVVAVSCVMLIACSNVATLMLARASVRARENVIRVALGANRRRIVAQLLEEGLALALLAVAFGFLVTAWMHSLLLWVSGENGALTVILRSAQVDWRVLLFAVSIALIAPVLIALLPILYTLRLSLSDTLSAAGRSAVQSGGLHMRRIMVVTQIALALALMTSAGALLRSMVQLSSRELGFASERTLTLRIELPVEKYSKETLVSQFFNTARDRIRALPEVEGVAWTNRRPLMPAGSRKNFSIEGRSELPGQMPWGAVQIVDPNYHQLLEIPLLQGRLLAETDTENSLRVALVDRYLAELYWPGRSAVAETIRLDGKEGRQIRIVGVVDDVYSGNSRQPITPILYLPRQQNPQPAMDLVLRTRRTDPLALVPSVRRQIWEVDPMIPIDTVTTIQQLQRDLLSGFGVLSTLLAIFAGFSLLMAAAGIYGVTSFSVGQRVREIGLRLALGAVSADVRRMIVLQVLRLTLLGIGLGLGAAILLNRLLEASLSEAHASDPVTYIEVAGVLLVVALIAAYQPVRSATSVDPMKALRVE